MGLFKANKYKTLPCLLCLASFTSTAFHRFNHKPHSFEIIRDILDNGSYREYSRVGRARTPVRLLFSASPLNLPTCTRTMGAC